MKKGDNHHQGQRIKKKKITIIEVGNTSKEGNEHQHHQQIEKRI